MPAQAIAAIPTIYNGVRFRSRLEAKWAAFFDLMRWKWEYEPIDLKGYIPDFLFVGHHKLFVDVKPITEYPEGFNEREEELEDLIDDDVVILGACVFEVGLKTKWWNKDKRRITVCTKLLGRCRSEKKWNDAIIGWCLKCKRVSLDAQQGCITCGQIDLLINPETWLQPEEKWKEACNTVQWKGR